MSRVFGMLLTLAAPTLLAQDVLPLWEGEAPYAKANDLEEYVAESWGVPCAHNVTRPTLTVFAPMGDNASRAVVILPGGGYEKESFIAEGVTIARYLSSRGITAAVLKYRLPLTAASDQPHLLPETDARQGIRLLRSLAGRYGFDPAWVGVMGFSAGGHLATVASVLPADDEQGRPDFSLLVYPVTTLSEDNRKWLEETLFHRTMTPEERRRHSLVDHVDAATPPAFLAHAYDDDVVPISESQDYAAAMVDAGREVEAHLFARGGHGFGPGRREDGTDRWLELAADWIRRRTARPEAL